MINVEVVIILFLAYCVFLLVRPHKPCNCTGRCPRCKGTGKRFRPGARLLRRGLNTTARHLREMREARDR